MTYSKINLINFRDLGGMKTKDGKRIKTGYLFRSGQPGKNIDEMTIQGIKELNLNTIFDLRDPATIAGRTDYEFEGVKNVPIPVLETIDPKFRNGPFDFKAIDVGLWDYKDCSYKNYKNRYKEYLKLYSEIPFSMGFCKVFEALDNHERVLLHCQGGKDRTGILLIIILKALGVNNHTILKDYLISNKYRKEKNKWRIKDAYEKSHHWYCAYCMKKLCVCERKYFNITLKTIKKNYGSFDNYLEKHFAIDSARITNWREFYLI